MGRTHETRQQREQAPSLANKSTRKLNTRQDTKLCGASKARDDEASTAQRKPSFILLFWGQCRHAANLVVSECSGKFIEVDLAISIEVECAKHFVDLC